MPQCRGTSFGHGGPYGDRELLSALDYTPGPDALLWALMETYRDDEEFRRGIDQAANAEQEE